MAVYISPKKSWAAFFLSLCVAGGAAFLLNFLLSGPRLGVWYDFLLRFRDEPPVSRDLLLIESGAGDSGPGRVLEDEVLDPGALASMLITLTEMEAAALVIQAPVLGLSPGGEEGIVDRFDGEFSLLGRNIRNLFEAIRAGSVAPADSDRYVGELVELAERGKERLLAALTGRDREGMIRYERAAGAFGQIWQAGDLGFQPALSGASGAAWYSRISLDWDGRFRRITPVTAAGGAGGERGHVIYGLFRSRYRNFGIEEGEGGPVLRNTASAAGERLIPLDRGGAILIEPPRGEADFRRGGLGLFAEYEEEDRALRRLLGEAELRGLYNNLEPEDYPSLRYDYALALREDMLDDPSPARKSRWREARKGWLKGLDDFLYGPAEAALVRGYEELIASGELDEGGVLRLTGMRNELIGTFAAIREGYQRLVGLRRNLETNLSAALCILGPASRAGLSGPEASAIFANSLLTGRVIIPEEERLMLPLSLGCALFCLLCLRRRGPLFSLGLGLLITLLTAGGFSWRFIVSAYWIDPLIPSGTVLGAALSSSLCALVIKGRFVRGFRAAYGPLVSKARFQRLCRAGRPLPGETVKIRAAVVALRNSALAGREDREEPRAAAAAVKTFRETAARLFREAGAVAVGWGGDTALGAFGSPLEEAAGKGGKGSPDPAVRAAETVKRLIEGGKIPAGESWYFGIDAGECAFTWSALSGYGVFGRPAVRARILAGLASRYKVQALVSRSAGEALTGLELRRLDSLGAGDGGGKEAFYELVPGLGR
jgi:class 3 adenylate cyclase